MRDFVHIFPQYILLVFFKHARHPTKHIIKKRMRSEMSKIIIIGKANQKYYTFSNQPGRKNKRNSKILRLSFSSLQKNAPYCDHNPCYQNAKKITFTFFCLLFSTDYLDNCLSYDDINSTSVNFTHKKRLRHAKK